MATSQTAVAEVVVDWQGRRVVATVPATIAELELDLRPPVIRRTEQAASAVQLAGLHGAGTAEVAARLLLRSEGLASSAIEGLRATAASVAVAAAGEQGSGDVAAWVADNLAVVSDALDQPGDLDDEVLWRWHRRLMRHAIDLSDEHRGAWRDVLGWVGGANPLVAAHVATPAPSISAAMADLYAYAARGDVDPVTQAAVVHAQFETIHPFADGNGRIGRILIGRILAHRLDVAVPPPISQVMARDIGGYQAGLTLFRQGQASAWISWFADAVTEAAQRSEGVLVAVAEVTDRWRREVSHLRSDAAARRLVAHLPANPVVSAESAAVLIGSSREAARGALAVLVGMGVVAEVPASAPEGAGRPRRWFAAGDLLDLLGG